MVPRGEGASAWTPEHYHAHLHSFKSHHSYRGRYMHVAQVVFTQIKHPETVTQVLRAASAASQAYLLCEDQTQIVGVDASYIAGEQA